MLYELKFEAEPCRRRTCYKELYRSGSENTERHITHWLHFLWAAAIRNRANKWKPSCLKNCWKKYLTDIEPKYLCLCIIRVCEVYSNFVVKFDNDNKDSILLYRKMKLIIQNILFFLTYELHT